MNSVAQLVAESIDRSKSHNEIVTIHESAIRQLGPAGGPHSFEERVEAVKGELFAECEDWVENGEVTEYWGEDVDGNDWRVHVRAEVAR